MSKAEIVLIAKTIYRFIGGIDKGNAEEWSAISDEPPEKWEELEQWQRDDFLFLAEKVLEVLND